MLYAAIAAHRATASAPALVNAIDIQPQPQKLESLAATTNLMITAAKATDGIKARLFGGVGVFLGLLGGFSADWVAHGKVTRGEMIRAGGAFVVTAVASAVVLWSIYHWRSRDTEVEPAPA